MTIEKVSPEDAAELLEIYAPHVLHTAISFEVEVPSLAEFTERIKSITGKYPYIKAVENGRIIGYAYAGTFNARAAYDWSVETTVYVKEGLHGKGVGRTLYEQMERALMGMGIRNMNACIAVPKGQDPYLTDASIHFHQHMGFAMVGTFHDSGYKFGRWYDMAWMEKMIGEHLPEMEEVRFGEWVI